MRGTVSEKALPGDVRLWVTLVLKTNGLSDYVPELLDFYARLSLKYITVIS
jgi:hypothetical protein